MAKIVAIGSGERIFDAVPCERCAAEVAAYMESLALSAEETAAMLPEYDFACRKNCVPTPAGSSMAGTVAWIVVPLVLVGALWYARTRNR